MLKLLGRIARELNWARRRWSTASDREFHEGLYSTDNYDPFSPAYPGYITIRRFADLVEPYLPVAGTVLDLGCGPGEITCELAARRSDLAFVGIDHSSAAIAKAHKNISRRGLANVRFECGNVEQYEPPGRVELATLFDSFHHLIQPASLVRRLGARVERWALIEPRGSWLGTWQKDLDFDWIIHDLEKIRSRVEASINRPSPLDFPRGDPELVEGSSIVEESHSGDAVERRYTVDDLRRFFDGYALDLRGTIAGLESYPPAKGRNGSLRSRFGELEYRAYREIDEWLHSQNLDLHAKHWLIIVERGGAERTVDLQKLQQSPINPPPVAGPYDVKYGAYAGPTTALPREQIVGSIELTNEGWKPWSSGDDHIFTSYHWLDATGRIVMLDGVRTPLPRSIVSGETSTVAIRIVAPDAAGRYRLAIDLVCEGVTWFSQAGRPWREVPFVIKQA
jgi:SAM-dependent methyltransferase